MGREEQFRVLYRELRIEDQQRWYADRAAAYEAAHRQARRVRNCLLLMAAVAGVGAQFVSGTGRAGFGVAAALLAALATAVTAYDTLIGFQPLHKLYSDAATNLARAGLDWADGTGDLDRVEQVITTENGQWGQLVFKADSEPPVRSDHPAL